MNPESASTVIVAGSKPGARLPLVDDAVVLTANGSALLGPIYRRHCRVHVVSVCDSGNLAKLEHVQQAVSDCRPEELLVIGDAIAAPERFARERLGLTDTVVHTLDYAERFGFMRSAVGRRAYAIALRELNNPKRIWHAIRCLFGPAPMVWATCSTGLNAVFYARRRFAAAERVVTAGIGLQKGGHFYSVGSMSGTRARADRLLMRAWLPEARPWLQTTDEVMHALGRTPLWEGATFGVDDPAPAASRAGDGRS